MVPFVLTEQWITVHKPHNLLTFEDVSAKLMGFLCLTCEVSALTSILAFRLIPGAFDLYTELLRVEDSLLISRLIKR